MRLREVNAKARQLFGSASRPQDVRQGEGLSRLFAQGDGRLLPRRRGHCPTGLPAVGGSRGPGRLAITRIVGSEAGRRPPDHRRRLAPCRRAGLFPITADLRRPDTRAKRPALSARRRTGLFLPIYVCRGHGPERRRCSGFVRHRRGRRFHGCRFLLLHNGGRDWCNREHLRDRRWGWKIDRERRGRRHFVSRGDGIRGRYRRRDGRMKRCCDRLRLGRPSARWPEQREQCKCRNDRQRGNQDPVAPGGRRSADGCRRRQRSDLERGPLVPQSWRCEAGPGGGRMGRRRQAWLHRANRLFGFRRSVARSSRFDLGRRCGTLGAIRRQPRQCT
jgi:hypothetical protein